MKEREGEGMIYMVSVFSGDTQITSESIETKKLSMHSARYWKKLGYTVVMSIRTSEGRFFFDKSGNKVQEWTSF